MSSIAFEDYLSEERKAEIAEAAFRDICEERFRGDAERIFSNAAYKAVWSVVDEMFDGRAAERVAKKYPLSSRACLSIPCFVLNLLGESQRGQGTKHYGKRSSATNQPLVSAWHI